MTPDKHNNTTQSDPLDAPELVAATNPELTPGLHEDLDSVHTEPSAHGDRPQSEIPGPPDLVAATNPKMTPGLTDDVAELHADREVTPATSTEPPGTAAAPSFSEPVEDAGKQLAEWTRRNRTPVIAVGAASAAVLAWVVARRR